MVEQSLSRRFICAVLAPMVALTPVLLGGCVHSTTYPPKPSSKVRVVVQKGGLAFTKQGVTLPVVSSTAYFGCNPEAIKHARDGGRDLRIGKIYSLVTSLTVLLGFGLAIIIPLSVVSSNYIHSGNADLIDAMNIHNDTLACLGVARGR